MIRWYRTLAGLLMLILLLPDSAQASGSDQKISSLPTCQSSVFTGVFDYYFSPDFAHDRIAFVRAATLEHPAWAFYRSMDGGVTWSLNLNQNIPALSFSPRYAEDQTIFVPTYADGAVPAGFLRSQDRGATWERLALPPDGPPVGLELAVVNSDTIYNGVGGGPWPIDPSQLGVFRITFGKEKVVWEQLTQLRVNSVTLAPQFDRDPTLFIGEYYYKLTLGLRRSVDGGKTWVWSSNGIDLSSGLGGGGHTEATFAPGYPADHLIFARTVSRYYRSADGGASWQRVDALPERLDQPFEDPHWVLSPYFDRDRTAWIEYGAWMTTDAGDTWQRTWGGEVQDLAAREWCEGERCGVLLLGGSHTYEHDGVYKSFDLGRTWQCPDAPTPSWWPDVPPLQSVWLPVIGQ